MPLRVLPVLLATFALLFVSLPTTSQRLGETACAPGSFATDDLNQCGGGQPAGSGLQRAAESVIDVCISRSHQAEQHPSWRWLAPPLVAAVAALIASACCAHMLRLQAQLRSLQPTAEDERKPCTSRSRARDPSRWQACSSREDSAMLRSPPHSDGRSATGELGSSSSGGTIKQEQEQEQELSVDEGGTPTRQEVADRVALTSPFLAAAIRRRPFSQSASLSPPVSTSPCDDTTCSSRPPRVPAAPAVGRYDGTGPCTPANLSRCGSLPPLPAAGPSQPASLADLSSLAASTAPVHGRHPPPPSEPSLLSPFPSGGFSCMFERQASALPELMQLVAAYQAKCPGAVDFNSGEQAQGSRRSWEEPAGSCRPMAAQLTATSAGAAGAAGGEALGLPLPLLQSLVNPVHVEYLHGPDGRLEQLGAGASSRVYKALYNGDIIAAKELDIGGNPELRESFVTEVLLLQHLRHPHIIGYFGLSLTANKGVLLLEYAEGRDLHSALQLTAAGTNERLFGWRRRGRRVAYEVAKGLNYLHSKGVTHMDIKSGNVLLTASGEARLSDVGLSRHAALNTGSAATGARCIGTFAWMAPELLLDADNSCTPACDIYSYGVLLLEILTGERPIRGRMRSPKVPEECPQEVADLAMRCLATDPKQRPCAAQLLKELGMLLLKRAFAADRTTTNLLGSRTGSLTTGVKRRSADGVALRTLRLEPLGEGMRRSVSVMHYPLLEAAAQGFDQPSAAARLSALLQPQPEVVPQDHDLAQQEPDIQLRSYSSCGLE